MTLRFPHRNVHFESGKLKALLIGKIECSSPRLQLHANRKSQITHESTKITTKNTCKVVSLLKTTQKWAEKKIKNRENISDSNLGGDVKSSSARCVHIFCLQSSDVAM